MKTLYVSHWLVLSLALLLGCGVSLSPPKRISICEEQPAAIESQASETPKQLSALNKQAHIDTQKRSKSSSREPSREAWLTQLLQTKPEIFRISVDGGYNAELRVLKQTDPLSEKYGLTLCWISLPVTYAQMVVRDVRRFGRADNIYEEVSDKSDIVIINGGFYGSNDKYSPLGLVISQGRIKNNRSSWKIGGVLFQTRDSIQIQPIRSFKYSNSIANAIQCKPILVENGKIGIYSNDHNALNRAVIGLDNNKHIIVAGAFEDNGIALSLYEFAEFLIVDKRLGGPAVEIALNLDGGPGAHIFFPSINLHFGYTENNFVPNSIHFKLKR